MYARVNYLTPELRISYFIVEAFSHAAVKCSRLKNPSALKVKVRGVKSSRNKYERVRMIFRERIAFRRSCERKRLFLEGGNRFVVISASTDS